MYRLIIFLLLLLTSCKNADVKNVEKTDCSSTKIKYIEESNKEASIKTREYLSEDVEEFEKIYGKSQNNGDIDYLTGVLKVTKVNEKPVGISLLQNDNYDYQSDYQLVLTSLNDKKEIEKEVKIAPVLKKDENSFQKLSISQNKDYLIISFFYENDNESNSSFYVYDNELNQIINLNFRNSIDDTLGDVFLNGESIVDSQTIEGDIKQASQNRFKNEKEYLGNYLNKYDLKLSSIEDEFSKFTTIDNTSLILRIDYDKDKLDIK